MLQEIAAVDVDEKATTVVAFDETSMAAKAEAERRLENLKLENIQKTVRLFSKSWALLSSLIFDVDIHACNKTDQLFETSSPALPDVLSIGINFGEVLSTHGRNGQYTSIF